MLILSARVIGCLSQNCHHAGDLHGAGSVQSLVCGDGIAVVVLGGLYCSDLIGGLADGVVCECLSLSIPLGDSIAVGDHAVVGAELALGTLEGAVNDLAFLVGIDDGLDGIGDGGEDLAVRADDGGAEIGVHLDGCGIGVGRGGGLSGGGDGGKAELQLTGSLEGLIAYRLQNYREVPIAGSEFLHLKDKVLSFEELGALPLISLGRESKTYEFHSHFFMKRGINYVADTEAATIDQLVPLVKNNLGVAFVPEFIAKDAIDGHTVFEIALKEPLPERCMCMIRRNDDSLSIAAKRFKEIVTGAAKPEIIDKE